MKITDEKIDQLAHLARLEFDSESKKSIKTDLENILDFCEKLNEVDTEGVEPLIYMTDTTNNVREDIVDQAYTKEQILSNAPKKDSDYFRVPKVIEQNNIDRLVNHEDRRYNQHSDYLPNNLLHIIRRSG